MKSLFVVMALSLSLQALAAEVCLVRGALHDNPYISCTDKEEMKTSAKYERAEQTLAQTIKTLLDRGYSIKNVSEVSSNAEYTFIKQ